MMGKKLYFILGMFFILLLAKHSFAFGPYVHYSAMEKAHDQLISECPNVPILWSIGSHWDQLEADRNGPSHGCNVDIDDGLLNGNLSELVANEFMKIKSGFERYLRGEYDVEISEPIRRLSHYISDGMSIGQISGPSLWGWRDDLIDFACEGVSKKESWPSYVHPWENWEEGLIEFEDAVLQTYSVYRKDATKWFRGWPGLPTPRDVTHMTRRGVAQAATLTSSFILLAWDEALTDVQQ